LFAVKNNFLEFIPLEELSNFKKYLIEKFAKTDIYSEIKLYKYFDKPLETKLTNQILTLLLAFVSKLVDYDKKLSDKINAQLEESFKNKVDEETPIAVSKLEAKKQSIKIISTNKKHGKEKTKPIRKGKK
jgi:hypothetical protein